MRTLRVIAISLTYLIWTAKMKNGTPQNSSNYNNCSSNDMMQLGCPSAIAVNWWNFPPYVYRYNRTGDNSSRVIDGELKRIVELLIRSCCGDCTKFDYPDPTYPSEPLNKNAGRNDSMLFFPVIGKKTSDVFLTYPYFPVMEPPGSILFQKERDAQQMPGMVLKAVLSGWPVFVITIVMAAISGIIIWALDCFCNEGFSRSFFTGSMEGFWWAFVSMTTVGYGDKVPKSFIAKVFAFLWVIIGLVIIGIFIATISTNLTALCLADDANIQDKTTVVLQKSEEKTYVGNNQGTAEEVGTIDEFVSKVLSDEDKGGLLDSYVAGYYNKELSMLRFANIFEDIEYAYGFVLTNQLNNIVIPKCLRRMLIIKQKEIDRILNSMNTLRKPPPNLALEKSLRLLDGNSEIFQTAVCICLVLSVILLLLGYVWQLCYKGPRFETNIESDKDKEIPSTSTDVPVPPRVSYLEVYTSQCQEIEDDVVHAVDTFYKRFSDEMNVMDARFQADRMKGNGSIKGKLNFRQKIKLPWECWA